MNLVKLPEKKFENWNAFVDSSAQGSIFCKTWYLNILNADYDIYCLYDNNKIKAGFAYTRDVLGFRSNPLFVKYLGVLLEPIDGSLISRRFKEESLTEQILSLLSKNKQFNYTFHPNYPNWLPFYWKGYRQQTRYTYILNLSKGWEQIWASVKNTVRTDYRKAEKNGIEIREISPDDFYSIYKKTFQRQGGNPPLGFARFLNICNKLIKINAVKLIASVNSDNEFLAAAGILIEKKATYLIWCGYDHTKCVGGEQTYAILNAIRSVIGISEIFDFEGSMIKGIAKYYSSFGGDLTTYHKIWRPSLVNFTKEFTVGTYKKLNYRR